MTQNLQNIYLDKLLHYQIPHVNHLLSCFSKVDVVLDASDTGTGKTYCSLVLCCMLKLNPFIVCPKAVTSNWINVAKELGINIVGITNFEKLKVNKYYDQNLKLSKCSYILKNKQYNQHQHEIKEDGTIKIKIKNKKMTQTEKKIRKEKETYNLNFPENTIIIIDEAHQCKNYKSINCKIMFGMKDTGRKILLLSATITDKVECFKPFGKMFGFYKDVKKYNLWVEHFLQKKKLELQTLQDVSDDHIILQIIHSAVFPKRGSRMSIKDLGDMFPKNQIIAQCYYSENINKINSLYKSMNDAIENNALGQIIKCRIEIELLKIPIILEELSIGLNNGYSCAIFVNFKKTMFTLEKHISVKSVLIYGDQSSEERQSNINLFQQNIVHVIICIIQAGGVGISLHDLYGIPRMSIISPSWSGSDIIQTLGRIHRAGSKSPALQRIIYIAQSYEEEICKKLNNKLHTLSSINTGNKSDINIIDD